MNGKPAAALGLWLAASPCLAAEVVAVLSADSGPYREAFTAFQDSFGSPVPMLTVSGGKVRIPTEARVVVAFGGKAARLGYPRRVALVYGVAPGTLVEREGRRGQSTWIRMIPRADVLLSRLRLLQPSLKRLAVLWSDRAFVDTLERLREAGRPLGVSIVSQRVASVKGLPDQLRGLQGRADAVWLAPDPLLITPDNFALILNFARANRLAFYAPTDGILEKGAAACVGVSSRETGKQAAAAAKALLAGDFVPAQLYPETTSLGLNLPAAAEMGLHLTPAAVKAADKVIR